MEGAGACGGPDHKNDQGVKHVAHFRLAQTQPGAHTQCCSLPISIPATLARTMGSPAMGLVLPGRSPLFRLFRSLFLPFRTQPLGLAIRGFCPRPRGVLQEPHQCSIAFLEPCYTGAHK